MSVEVLSDRWMIAHIEGRGMWDVGCGASDYGVEVAKTLALG